MDLMWMLQWWNLVFLVPLGLSLVYLGLYVATGVTFGGDGADVDADADVHADLDTDADADAGGHELQADAEHDAEASQEHEAADSGGSTAMDVFLWLGAGRLPLSLLLMLFAMIWGLIGFNVNRVLMRSGYATWIIPMISMPLALLAAALLTRWIARLVARFLPMSENQVERRDALVGCSGVALGPIDSAFGLVQVRTARGGLFQVSCRVAPERAAIGKDEKVLLVDYDKQGSFFYVIPDELGRCELER